MWNKALWFVPALLLLAASASGDPPDGADMLGFYTADDGSGLANVNAEVGEQITIFMCLTGCSAEAGVYCWEWFVEVPSGVTIFSYMYWGCAEDWGCFPDCSFCLMCGPLECEDIVPVGTFTFIVTDPGPQYFYLHPPSNPSIPDAMAYLDANFEIHPMVPSSGREDCAVFGVNTGPLDCDGNTISVEAMSWSVVRELYE